MMSVSRLKCTGLASTDGTLSTFPPGPAPPSSLSLTLSATSGPWSLTRLRILPGRATCRAVWWSTTTTWPPGQPGWSPVVTDCR